MTALSGETLAQFLDRREKDLLALVSALRGQLYPAEAELAQVQQIKGLLVEGRTTEAANALLPQRNSNALLEASTILGLNTPKADHALSRVVAEMHDVAKSAPMGNALYPSRHTHMTIKELTIQALIDHFPNGATVSEIREFIRAGYGRSVEAASLRAQMHRLKADHVLTQEGELWNLVPRKRQLYGMYDHPTSCAAMKELQDEQPDRDGIGPPVTD